MWNDEVNAIYRQAGRVQPGGAKPLAEAVRLSEYIRYELGREGVRQFLSALCPLVPRDFLCEIAESVGEAVPDPPPKKSDPPAEDRPRARSPGMGMEEMMLLMQAMQGSKGEGGLDPRLLMKLLGKQSGGKD